MRSAERFILEINDRMVGGLHCKVAKNSLVPVTSRVVQLEPAQDWLEAAREVVTRIGVRDCGCHLSLPGSLFYFKVFSVPFTDRRKVDEVLHYELMDRVSFSDEPFLFDSTTVMRSSTHTRLLAGVARAHRLEPWLELLNEHQMRAELITVSPMGRVLQLVDESGSGDSFLYLDAGHNASTCFLVRDSTVQSIRTLAGAAQSEGNALIAELQRTVRALAADWDEGESMDLLVGGAMAASAPAALSGSDDFFRSSSVIDTDDLVIGGTDGGGQLPLHAEQLLLATAALNPADQRLLNLTRGAAKKARSFSALKRFVPLFGLGLVLLLCGSAYQLYEYFTLVRQHDTLAAEAAAIYRETLEGEEAPVDPLSALKARINDIDASPIAGIVEHPEITAVSVLADLSKRLPPSIRVSFERFSFDRKTVRLNGVTDTYSDVDRIRQSFESSLLYTAVSIDSAGSADEDGGVGFALTLSL